MPSEDIAASISQWANAEKKTSAIFSRSNMTFLGNGNFLAIKDESRGLALAECEFKGIITFEGETDRDFTFESCTFEQSVYINMNHSGIVKFYNCIFKSNFQIESEMLNRFSLRADVKTLIIKDSEINEAIITSDIRHKIDLLSIDFDKVRGNLKLSHLDIDTIEMKGIVSKDTSLDISFCNFGTISVLKLMNEGKIRMFDLNSRNYYNYKDVFVDQSNLGKLEFNTINFGKYPSVTFHRSYITECSLINITWPKSYTKLPRGREKADYRNLKDIYRQLKFIYNKQGDYLNEHDFHALEMKAKLKTIRFFEKESDQSFLQKTL